MAKRALQSFVSLFLGLLAGLFLAEIGARLFYPLPVDLKTSHVINVGIPPAYSPYIGGSIPWAHSVIPYEVEDEYTTTVSINAKGLRGPEVPYEKPAGEFRILFLGDSYVEAIQVGFEETVYQQLKTLLGKLPKRYEIIGAGYSGWGTDQAYLYYMSEGYKYQPDLVIYQFVTNDVTDNARNLFDPSSRVGQYFSLKDGNLVRRNLNDHLSPSYQYALALHRYLLLSSRFYALIRDIWRGDGAALAAHPLYMQKGSLCSSAKPQPQLFIYEEPYSDNYNAAWELSEAILLEWSTRVRADGTLFAVVSVPGRWAIYNENWQEIPKCYPDLAAEFAKWNPDKPDEYLSNITGRHDIPYLSLTPTFRAYAAENDQRLYGHKDGHWTTKGHSLAAQTIFKWLLEQEQFWYPLYRF